MAENQNGASGAQAGTEENDVELVVPEVDDDNPDPEAIKALKTVAKTAIAQKIHWRGQAINPATGKKWKEEVAPPLKPSTSDNGGTTAQVDDAVRQDVEALKTAEEKRTFGHNNGLSPEETDQVFAYAKGMGVKPKEALESPFFKNALDTFRSTQRATGATPGPSSRQPLVEGKSWGEMNTEEKRKNFGAFTKSLSGRK